MSFDFDAHETLAQHPKLLSALLTTGALLSMAGSAVAVSSSVAGHFGP
ncbi:DUF7503 family protein [Salinirubrum litoreum]|uniref:Uncharacterized protein n=1 Tax=Salinirubrum litoreum TaxID=1126234 RepID=A0ABD5R9K4_9EURY|nr:hypothetical protein [Salinirubrum litoreum]